MFVNLLFEIIVIAAHREIKKEIFRGKTLTITRFPLGFFLRDSFIALHFLLLKSEEET
jgi:hypothetical protein